jgi:recombination protein RecT
MNALETIKTDIYSTKQNFSAICSDRNMSFDAEAGFAMQTLSANEFAQKVALSNRQSVINAVTNIAAIGISLNPAKKQAYLVPRDGRICLDISYMGLMDLAMQSGSILWAQCALVHEADEFTLNGLDKQPQHKFNPFAKDRGEVIGVYVVVKTADGEYLTTAMSMEEIESIRDRSSAWKAWMEKKRSCPWVTDFGEMAKKTCVKRAYKFWPKTDRLETAIHLLNTDGGEGLQSIQPEKETQIDVVPLIAEALKTRTDAEALQYWKDHNGKVAKQTADHARLKKSIMDHRAKLKAEEARTIEQPETPNDISQ